MFWILFLVLQNFPEKNGFLAAIVVKICLKNSQADLFSRRSWIKLGVISCAPHTPFDEINSVVKSERDELVSGFDTPLVYSAHSTTGDVWRAPIRLLFKTPLAADVWKTETKTFCPL